MKTGLSAGAIQGHNPEGLVQSYGQTRYSL